MKTTNNWHRKVKQVVAYMLTVLMLFQQADLTVFAQAEQTEEIHQENQPETLAVQEFSSDSADEQETATKTATESSNESGETILLEGTEGENNLQVQEEPEKAITPEIQGETSSQSALESQGESSNQTTPDPQGESDGQITPEPQEESSDETTPESQGEAGGQTDSQLQEEAGDATDPETSAENEASDDSGTLEDVEHLDQSEDSQKEPDSEISFSLEVQNFACQVGTAQILAEVSEEALLPYNSEFLVQPLDTQSAALDLVKQELRESDASMELVEAVEAVGYDLGFYLEGAAVQPQAPVKITMDFADAILPPESGLTYTRNSEVRLYHVENGTAQRVDADIVKDETESVKQVSFTADHFSPYILVRISEINTQTEFVWEDSEKTVTAVLSDAKALPAGVSFIVSNVSTEREKELGDLLEASIDEEAKDKVLLGYAVYDMHFELNGQEIEPQDAVISVSVDYKQAISLSEDTPDYISSEGVSIVHVAEGENLEEVTEDVSLNQSGDVESAEFTVDSFSEVIVTETGTIHASFGSDYSLEYILNRFNIVSFGDVVMNTHCMGSVLIEGDYSGAGSGFADSAYANVPSYIGGIVSYSGQHNSRNNLSQNIDLFVGTQNEVTDNYTALNGKAGYNKSGKVYKTDQYVDWGALKAAIQATSTTLSGYSVETLTAKGDWSNNSVNVTAGTNVVLDLNGYQNVKVNIVGTSEKATVINILNSGSVSLPQIINGWSTAEDGSNAGMSVVWNLPNATGVSIPSSATPVFGHVVAPNAAISMESGNYNGSLVGKSITLGWGAEGHMWPYIGGSLIPTSTGYSAVKTVDGAAPTESQIFTFLLEELKNGAWTSVEEVSNDGSSIDFTEMKYSNTAALGQHWYRIRENQTPIEGYNLDDTQYLICVEVSSQQDGNNIVYSITNENYYKTDAAELLQADGTLDTSKLISCNKTDVAFENTTIPEEETTSRTVTKIWEDNSDQDGLRPESIEVQLYADGETLGDPVTLTEATGWKHTWTGLEQNSSAGKAIVYTVEEITQSKDYQSSIDQDTLTITNTHKTESTSRTVTKIWEDGNNQDGLRPDSIGVQLYANDEAQGDPVTLNETNQWSYTWENLAKNEAGEVITYTVQEVKIPEGYSVEEIQTEGDTFTITNTHTPKLASVFIRKVDVTNYEELEGAVLQILDQDGEIIETWTSGKEAHEVNGLKTGETYTIRETSAPKGYAITSDTTFELNADGTINTERSTISISEEGILLVEDERIVGSITVTKQVAELNEELDDYRILIPEDASFYVRLFTDEAGTEPYSEVKEIRIQNAASGSVTFENLPTGTYYVFETNEAGEAIPYDDMKDENRQFFCTILDEESEPLIEIDTQANQIEGEVNLTNVYSSIPEGYDLRATLKVNKMILKDEEQVDVEDVFYVGVFSDDNLETADVAIVKLENNGSVNIEIPVEGDGTQPVTYWIYETDENGARVADLDGFAYVVIGEDVVTFDTDEHGLEQEVTLINQIIEEKETEPTPTAAPTTTPTATPTVAPTKAVTATPGVTETASPKTGDSSGRDLYMLLLAAAFMGICGTVSGKKRRNHK
jgi:choice-of-anchor A domain-containing protein